jgi:hypothetical protein
VAVEANDIHLLRQAIHKIKPVFNIIGLLTVAQEVGRFYDLCLKASSVEEITGDYTELWPKLINARSLVKRQTELLYAPVQKIA